MSDGSPIIVTPVARSEGASHWMPVVGPETTDFLNDVVPEDSRESLCSAAVSILGKGTPPTAGAGEETGLVVGYVQSGKTMSFESVAALARDNNFQIVIVVAGISIPLFDQSSGRLCRDLRLDKPDRPRRWIQFKNPSNDDATVSAIRDVLEDWRDPSTPDEYKRTILITILKNHRRLQNLANIVTKLDMQNVPVLIIDDEADQASLNIEVAQGQESTTYRCLMELRQRLPNHTYLQYTATPQAPLLLNIIDSLSPNFVQVLEPGNDYVGGCEFFDDDVSYVRVIPPHEVPFSSNLLIEPPESLLEALRVFLVGVTVGFLSHKNFGNRSMLVHPSHLTIQHQQFYNWVRDIFEEWKRVLKLHGTDPDRLELIEEFREAYDDLAETCGPDLPVFDEIVPMFSWAFRQTRVLEVNARAGRTPQVNWCNAYAWILVGGKAIDRGFTVEGLTVTYMPRGIGVGNADTVQQRGRFFGYKRSYLGYCRIYLDQDTLSAFCNYVVHEEDIRRQLEKIQQHDRPLDEWKRAFVLDNDLRPCRDQVLEFNYIRGQFSDEWVAPRVVRASDSVVQANRGVVATFMQGLAFDDDAGHRRRTDVQRHSVCREVPLHNVIEQLLVSMRITGFTDSHRNTGMLLQLSHALEKNPDEFCTVYWMSPCFRRQRGICENGEVTNLFQGQAPVYPRERRGEIYPGDRAIREQCTVTIQVHTLDLTDNSGIVMENVPVIAVWVPARLVLGWISQDQPN